MSSKIKNRSTSSDESEVETASTSRDNKQNLKKFHSNMMTDKIKHKATSSDESELETLSPISYPKQTGSKTLLTVQNLCKVLLTVETSLNLTEIEWLQLSNAAHSQQSNSPIENKSESYFKDAVDINAAFLEELSCVPKEYDNLYNSDPE